ncbi:FAD-binding oxidoreductase [Vibrio cholerae]|uniref:FAD-binding oxidoreductase n=1 Tax=Vibrio cholerae TaxID=666 RepID=UPI001A1C5714|nr:2Fe-2S iron-sulfur cluster binding domain-containing protein [Vibrio cholerae]EJK2994627.1 2Fe-2S iron-sulfur cluster binding domain-containing protein [Vibrio cholerae]EJL6514160.1 2Fe-2S iron-sulfur cluster binding domain-containing protein [Vibrio cholerae]EJL6659292.1 2Fe-2S iron-sulfur cluster binding domain-containing protein [Vibrio cholerae]EJL6905604.1 2Fe-2S iron-sulfur cluster binding domain-containing protein [Vibrio cholerae]
MSYHIEIQPAGVSYRSEDNLLDDALNSSFPLEHSCKTGDCGVCIAEVVSGEIENEYGELVTSGAVLTCQSKPKSNAVLKANYYPELAHLKEQILPCKLVSINYPVKDIAILRLRFPPTSKFDYLPGQYVDLMFKGIKRSYSIANTQSDSKEIELHIRRVPQGKMSELIFGQVNENQLMRVSGPKGTFFIRNGNRPLIFVATGTGIAPIKAMTEQLIKCQDTRSIYIYWGMRYITELYFEELHELANSYEHIHFSPVLSREMNSGKYRKGYIQDAVLSDFSSLENVSVYACGSPNMIKSAKALLIENGLPSEHFYSDAFIPAK